MKKKLLSMMLCGILALSMIGCGGDDAKKEEAAPAVETKKEEPAPAPAEEKEEAPAEETTEEASTDLLTITIPENGFNPNYDTVSFDQSGYIFEIKVDPSVTGVEFFEAKLNDAGNMELGLSYGGLYEFSNGAFNLEYDVPEGIPSKAMVVYTETQTFLYLPQYDGVDGKVYLTNAEFADPKYSQGMPAGGAANAAGDAFLGTWGCGRATLTIEPEAAGQYFCSVTWASSAADGASWYYTCEYDASMDALVCDALGNKVTYSYADENSEPEENIENTSMSATFAMTSEGIVWNDFEENSGDGMVFVK